MPEVRRSVERRLWKNLCKAFGKVIDALKQGTGTVEKTEHERTLIRQFMNSREMNEYLTSAVGNMVHAVRTESAKEFKDDILAQQASRDIYAAVQNEMNGKLGSLVWQIMAGDVAYFKSLPDEWMEYIRKYTFEETMKGKRPEVIEQELRKVIPAHIKTNLKTVARTMSAKANAAIVQARAQMVGINAYIWRSVKDERTRDSHAHMDGVIVYYNDPPSPEELIGKKSYGKYHAGNTYNCRCWQKVIVDPKMLPNIVRVYHNGSIQTMGKNVMLQRFGKVA